MPTYAFQCTECRHEQDYTCPWRDRPSTLACEACGHTSEPLITGGIEPLVKDTTWQWDRATNVPSMGRFVRSDQEQHRRYQKIVSEAKRDAKNFRKNLAKKDDTQLELIGRVPLEAHEGVVEALHDKQAWTKDTVGLLKKTGFYCGE